jgi:branched-chain amino acid transport system substrate-binding protein
MAEAGQMAQAQAGFGKQVKTWLVLALAAMLAACSVVPKGPPRTTDAPPEQPTGPRPGLPSDAARHRIALLVPITGTNAGVGESIANAATMAVLDTGGKSIRVTTYDTANGAAAAAQKAIAEGNQLILGPLLADDVRAVAPVARASRIPIISFSNDVSVAGQGTYLMGFVPTQSVDRIIAYARSKGLSRFAGLVPTGLYGQRASTAFVRATEAYGGQLLAVETFERTPGSIQAAVRKLGSASAYDALLVADSGRVAMQIVPLIRRAGGQSTRLLGTELWNTEGSLSQNTPMHGAWFASVSDGFYSQLATKYRARYNKAPFRLASLGYDSVLLVSRIATKWPFNAAFPIAELTDPGGFTGIDGAFRFGRDGVADRALEVQQINPGAFGVISPAPKSFAR